MKKIYYGDIPTSVQQITKKYIQDFFRVKTREGTISQEELDWWIKVVENAETENTTSPIKAFNAYRKEFVKKYYPELDKDKKKKEKEDAADFYKKLRGVNNNKEE